MPKFITESVDFIPMSGATIDLSSGVLSIPTGTTVSDVEVRTIDGASVALSGEIKFIESSGILVMASGAGLWINISMV
jgi:hypothetical protein